MRTTISLANLEDLVRELMLEAGERTSPTVIGRIFLITYSVLISCVCVEGILHFFNLADLPAFEVSRDYGYRLKPDQWASPRGYRFHINHAGLRGSDFVVPKPVNTYRIVFLGDSITYGGGSIQDSALFVNRVAAALSNARRGLVEPVNISVPGWGIENVSRFIETEGTFGADLVVWIISSPDFRRPMTSMADYGFPDTKPRIRLFYVLQERFLNRWWSYLSHGYERKSSVSSEEILQRNLRVVRGALVKLIEKHTPIVVVVVPEEFGAKEEDLELFRAAAVSSSVPFLDTSPALRSQQPGRLYLDGVHLNRRGHEVVAVALTVYLEREILGAAAQQRRAGQQMSSSGTTSPVPAGSAPLN